MDAFDRIVEISASDDVKLAADFKELLHTELQFGMSNYVCRHGTLGDGFECLSEADRYYRAVKEAFNRSQTIEQYQCDAMLYRADILEAQQALENPKIGEIERIRAESNLKRAKLKLAEKLIATEDVRRQMTVFLEVAKELQASVRAQYPKGIEQAEPEKWKAVAMYRAAMQSIKKSDQHLQHVPLPADEKARIYSSTGISEFAVPYAVEHKLSDIEPSTIKKALEHKHEKLLSSVRS